MSHGSIMLSHEAGIHLNGVVRQVPPLPKVTLITGVPAQCMAWNLRRLISSSSTQKLADRCMSVRNKQRVCCVYCWKTGAQSSKFQKKLRGVSGCRLKRGFTCSSSSTALQSSMSQSASVVGTNEKSSRVLRLCFDMAPQSSRADSSCLCTHCKLSSSGARPGKMRTSLPTFRRHSQPKQFQVRGVSRAWHRRTPCTSYCCQLKTAMST